MRFSELFDGTPRPTDAGVVTIRFEEINNVRHGRVIRPIAVWGIVVPIGTKGRDQAPSPLAPIALAGIPDTHKGHLLALELGGPDVSQNIVPQWAGFQSSGVWRRMETTIKRDAVALARKGLKLFFGCGVAYPQQVDLERVGLRRLSYPTGFVVATQTYDPRTKQLGTKREVRFSQEQSQDATDELKSLRTMFKGKEQVAVAAFRDLKMAKRRGEQKLRIDLKATSVHALRPAPSLTYSITDMSPARGFAVDFVNNARTVASGSFFEIGKRPAEDSSDSSFMSVDPSSSSEESLDDAMEL